MSKNISSRFILSAVMLLTVFVASNVLPVTVLHAQTPALDQRLEQYKKDRAINLKAETQSLKIRCSVAQASLKNLQTRIGAAQTTRETAYKNISDVLTKMETRLSNQAFEVTNLKTIIDTYNVKVTEYKTNFGIYKQAVDDAVAVDCAANPYGFRGALETARLYHDKLVPNITDIREYTTNTAKTSLDQIKEQLASGRTTGGMQ